MGGSMTWIFVMLGFALVVASWFILRLLIRHGRSYQRRLQQEARHTLDAAFLFLDLARLGPALLVAPLALALLLAWLAGTWWAGALVLFTFLVLPPFVLKALRDRRAARFDAQLPDLLQALAGALQAGAGVQAALQHLVLQSPAPLSQEFGLLLREQRLGLDFQAALAKLRERMPTESCGLVVSALGIAAQTGGGLADTLERMAQTLRARQHWRGRVRALTAQGRMQSWVMAGLPLLLLAVLSKLEPDAMALLWTTMVGRLILIAILGLEVIGLMWIRRLVAIDV